MELYSVIKNDGPGDLLFWKFLGEDFRTGSQLIVAENEEALFVKDGRVVNTFSGGKFELKTNNYPFIDTLRSAFSGGVSAFNCKVYFISLTDMLELKWGTDSPIQMRDPVYGIMTQVQGRGAYTIRVVDSKKFLLKFVGNNIQAVTSDVIVSLFRSVFLQKVKSSIAKAIRESGEEILGLCERQEELAEIIKPMMESVMEEYGLEIVNFYIGALDIPATDPARVKLETAFANKAEMQVLGQEWQRIQGRDILLSTAQNEGAAGAAAGAGAGIGMGMAAGGAMGAMASSVFSPFAAQQQQQPPVQPTPPVGSRFTVKSNPPEKYAECPQCHEKIADGVKFCGNCGANVAPAKTFCINCGKELAQGAKFCGECGTKQEA